MQAPAAEMPAARPSGEAEEPEPAPETIDSLRARYLDEVFAYVLQRVSNYADAEDLTAQTFGAAFASLPRFRGDCRPDAWLITIARQQIALARRKFWRTRRLERLEADLSAAERETLAHLLTADPRQLPEDQALRNEARRMMRRLLARLPERQREALLLQTYHGLSVREIAQALGCTTSAANSLIERARATIFRLGRDYFGSR